MAKKQTDAERLIETDKESRMRPWILLLALLASLCHADGGIDSFGEAKVAMRRNVYHDQTEAGELYCGCKWRWNGNSTGGTIDLQSCGYEPRKQPDRATRLEWEHIMPAENFGRQRACWRDGGRKNCAANDAQFRAMESDLHNLAPSVGEVNGDRGHRRYGVISSSTPGYGACKTKVDFDDDVAEPRDEVKGMVARATLYMHDHYQLRMSDQQRKLMTAWDRQHPVTEWERERDRRIAAVMGWSNPYVTQQNPRGHQ